MASSAEVLEEEQGSVLVTGGAGFIGTQVTEALLKRGESVVVLDNFEPYYDVRLKRWNIEVKI
jgi:UDP-glucuronate 4-epimerase